MRTRLFPAAAGLFGVLCCMAASVAAEGLTISADQVPWARLQTRIGVAFSTPLGTDLATPGLVGLQGSRILGDYYFSAAPAVPGNMLMGGFRATGGILLAGHGASLALPNVPRPGIALNLSQQALPYSSPLDPGIESHAVPYVGVGYTGLSVKGTWGFTADVGVMALGSGNGLRATQLQTTGQMLDDTLRDLRLTPVLQVGVSYSF